MPEVKNCRECKKIFMYAAGPQICDACKQRDEEEFHKVRKYLRDYPGATMQEVSAGTEVSMVKINKFLRDDRIEVAENSPIALQCENCGVRIRSGRFCVDCSKTLARDMMSAGKSLQDSLARKQTINADEKEAGLRYRHRDGK